MRIKILLPTTVFLSGLALSGCGGIADCGEDGAKCAEMLNNNAEKCAQAYQLQQGQAKRKHCENAVKTVADGKVEAAIPGLTAIVKAPESSVPYDEHRAKAAKALARLGAKSAVPTLLEAIDLTAGTSSDPRDKNANASNEAIAESLGDLSDTAACGKLVELMNKSRHNYTVLKALRSLGKLKCTESVEAVENVALKHDNKFMRKNATVALGEIGDPAATDTLIQMMFVEYQGVSFYPEASFSLYQIGPAVADQLLATMSGKNDAVKQYFATKGGLMNTAVKAKCGFVLGDLRDARALDPLIEAFKGSKEGGDPVLLIYSAAPLGFLGDKKAVPVLQAEMLDLDGSKREPIMRALNQIGDRSVVPDMIKGMTKAHFVDACVKLGLAGKSACEADVQSMVTAMKPAADHAANLGGAEHFDAYKAAVDAMEIEAVKKYMQERLVRLEAAKECKEDVACWIKKAGSDKPAIREKAAWELGRVKDKSAVAAMMKLLGDDDLYVRSAAIFASWGVVGKDAIAEIEKRLEDEQGSSKFVRVNQDLKRLLVKLKRS